MAGSNRAGKAQVMERVEIVRDMLLRGHRASAVVKFLTTKQGLGERQAWEYVKKAHQAMESAFQEANRTAMAEHLDVRRDLRKQGYAEHDYRLVLEVMRDEAKLLGLYPKVRIGVSIDDVLDALPRDFRDGVLSALADAVSEEGS
jgi:GNAT superfamily N-acetyltransferase